MCQLLIKIYCIAITVHVSLLISDIRAVIDRWKITILYYLGFEKKL